MECRTQCAACCISISISSPLPGLPLGKPAGVRCIHLDEDRRCRLWGSAEYPKVCANFRPGPDCGQTRDEALAILGRLETLTAPASLF